MKQLKACLFVSVALAALSAAPAAAQTVGVHVAQGQGAAGPPAARPTGPATPPALPSAVPVRVATPADEIIVTARRTSERLQDIPVAVSVIQTKTIEAKGVFSPIDLGQSAPSLTVGPQTASRTDLVFTIRGQGQAYGTLFPAVISYFDEVPITRLTQAEFFDLADIQILRGPQGVNFGRVTDGGNVLVASQKPKNEFGGYAGFKIGDYGLRTFQGAINIPIVDDKILFRAAYQNVRRSGYTKNIANGEDLDNEAYESYRGTLTIRPVAGLENTTVVNYAHIHNNGIGSVITRYNPNATGLLPTIGALSFVLSGAYGIDANGSVVPFRPGLTPLSAAAYGASLQSQLNAQTARGPRQVSLIDPSFNRRDDLYVLNTTTADLGSNIQLKNVFGYVHEKEDQTQNYVGANGGAVLICSSKCPVDSPVFSDTEQFSEELRLSGKSFGNRFTWSLGGYADKQRPAGPYGISSVTAGLLYRDSVNYLTTTSRAIYGSGEFAITDRLKVNGGVRYTHDTVHSEENSTLIRPIEGGQAALKAFLTGPFGGRLSSAVADAVVAATFAPIPAGQCTTYGAGSILYPAGPSACITRDASFSETTWSAGASYQFERGKLLYAKISKGYRPGGINGTAPLGLDPSYNPETDISIEAGLKTEFNFNNMFLRFNLAGYTDRYKAIQKSVTLEGTVPVSVVRNVDNARIKGIEAEITFIPVPGLTFGSTFSYTHAKFDPLPRAVIGDPCDPTQTTVVGFCSNNRFANTPKVQFSLRGEYAFELANDLGKVSIGGLVYHQSSSAFFDDSSLNPENIVAPYTTVDLTLNWREVSGRPVDLGFFITNVTNRLYRSGGTSLSQNSSVGVSTSFYAAPRMFGFSATYRFGGDAHGRDGG